MYPNHKDSLEKEEQLSPEEPDTQPPDSGPDPNVHQSVQNQSRPASPTPDDHSQPQSCLDGVTVDQPMHRQSDSDVWPTLSEDCLTTAEDQDEDDELNVQHDDEDSGDDYKETETCDPSPEQEELDVEDEEDSSAGFALQPR